MRCQHAVFLCNVADSVIARKHRCEVAGQLKPTCLRCRIGSNRPAVVMRNPAVGQPRSTAPWPGHTHRASAMPKSHALAIDTESEVQKGIDVGGDEHCASSVLSEGSLALEARLPPRGSISPAQVHHSPHARKLAIDAEPHRHARVLRGWKHAPGLRMWVCRRSPRCAR